MKTTRRDPQKWILITVFGIPLILVMLGLAGVHLSRIAANNSPTGVFLQDDRKIEEAAKNAFRRNHMPTVTMKTESIKQVDDGWEVVMLKPDGGPGYYTRWKSTVVFSGGKYRGARPELLGLAHD